MNNTDYPAIRLWGKCSGSLQYYINAQVEKARADKAPQNATYYGPDYSTDNVERWHTVDEIHDIYNRPEMYMFIQYLTKVEA